MAGFWDFLSDPQMLNSIGTVLQVGGQLTQARSNREYGAEAQASAEFQAAQMRELAGDAQASAQRAAFNEERQARIVASNALAAAAASGGGASDPTVINIIAGIAAEGAYRQSVALYEGDARARTLRLQALAKERDGQNVRNTSNLLGNTNLLAAGTTLLKGAAKDTMLARYGADGPPGSKARNGLDYF